MTTQLTTTPADQDKHMISVSYKDGRRINKCYLSMKSACEAFRIHDASTEVHYVTLPKRLQS